MLDAARKTALLAQQRPVLVESTAEDLPAQRKKLGWQIEAERFRSFKIDHEFALCNSHRGRSAGFSPFRTRPA
jgi:hypothetical protein